MALYPQQQQGRNDITAELVRQQGMGGGMPPSASMGTTGLTPQPAAMGAGGPPGGPMGPPGGPYQGLAQMGRMPQQQPSMPVPGISLPGTMSPGTLPPPMSPQAALTPLPQPPQPALGAQQQQPPYA